MCDVWLYAKNSKVNICDRNAYDPLKISLENDLEETDGEDRDSSSHGWSLNNECSSFVNGSN